MKFKQHRIIPYLKQCRIVTYNRFDYLLTRLHIDFDTNIENEIFFNVAGGDMNITYLSNQIKNIHEI